MLKAPPDRRGYRRPFSDSAHIAIMSAGGRSFTQEVAWKRRRTPARFLWICGHYELSMSASASFLDADELSIGDFCGWTTGARSRRWRSDATIRRCDRRREHRR